MWLFIGKFFYVIFIEKFVHSNHCHVGIWLACVADETKPRYSLYRGLVPKFAQMSIQRLHYRGGGGVDVEVSISWIHK